MSLARLRGKQSGNRSRQEQDELETHPRFVILNSSGNVGIGTTTPSARLDVSYSSSGTQALAQLGALQNGDDTIGVIGIASRNGGNPDVQIGMYGSARASVTDRTFGGYFTLSATEGLSVPSFARPVSSAALVADNTNMAADIFQARDNGSITFSIADGGNVGIGTATPQALFDVTAASTRYFRITNQGQVTIRSTDNSLRDVLILENPDASNVSYGIRLLFRMADANNSIREAASIEARPEQVWTTSGTTFDSYLRFSTVADGTTGEAMRISSAGNVGIGAPSPTEKLHVAGKIRVDTLADATATALCYDTTAKTLASCSSSRRYKENIQDLDLGLDTVLKLEPKSFKWRGRHEWDLGLIAEDVHNVSPLLNTYKGKQIEGVKYGQITAVLIRGVQQLKQMVDQMFSDHEERLNQLESSTPAGDTAALMAEMRDEIKALRAEVASLRTQR